MSKPLEDLAELTDALYQAELAKVRELAQHENALRRDLQELETHRVQSLALPDAHLHGVRQIGADMLWQAWVGRTKAQLNIQLAQVLVQKAALTKALRRAFGRQSAAAGLLSEARHAHRASHEKSRNLQEEQLQLLSQHRDQLGR